MKEKAEISKTLDFMGKDLEEMEKLTLEAGDYYTKAVAKGKTAGKAAPKAKAKKK